MDPNVALDEMREALKTAGTTADNGEWIEAAERAMDRAAALDEWLSKGGFLPEGWRHAHDAK